ncbi:hypothetical protein [Flavobacterium sp.]|uniref:hypothetical protein n=1 Tax=Flavobacterium sp. TaxID=239 RepID=UPI00261DB519|nr:hypothetical protein [Flavobacterium sp.]
MKKSILLLFMGGLFLTSCSDNFSEQQQTAKQNKGKFNVITYNTANGADGQQRIQNPTGTILSFDSEAEYWATVDSLEIVQENFIDGITRQYSGSLATLNNLVESNRIDLYEPLTNFENVYNFRSLRISIIERELLWMQTALPPYNDNPDIHPIASPSERCLWNERGEIMIEGKIYKYDDEVTKFIKIDDGSLSKLALINSGDTGIWQDESVDFIDLIAEMSSANQSGSLCKVATSNYNYEVNGNFVFTSYVALTRKTWAFGRHKLEANTRLYRRNFSATGLVNQVALLTTHPQGNRYVNCGTTPSAYSQSKTIAAYSNTVVFRRDNPFGSRIVNGNSSLFCNHSAASSSTNPAFQVILPFYEQ